MMPGSSILVMAAEDAMLTLMCRTVREHRREKLADIEESAHEREHREDHQRTRRQRQQYRHEPSHPTPPATRSAMLRILQCKDCKSGLVFYQRRQPWMEQREAGRKTSGRSHW